MSNLKVFNGGVIWVDSNNQITQQIQYFQFLLDGFFQFCPSVNEAIEFIKSNSQKNYIVMTNSKLIDEIKKEFKPIINSYSKYLIFCGTQARAKEMQEKHQDCLLKATIQVGSVIDIISSEDERQQKKQGINEIEESLLWVYHDGASEHYGRVHSKKMRWNYSTSIDLINIDEVKEKLAEDEEEKYILISNGTTELYDLLEECQNLQKWVKYAFCADAASPKDQSGDEDDDDNQLHNEKDGGYQGIQYAKSQFALAVRLGLKNQEKK